MNNYVKSTNRSKSYLAAEAIRGHIRINQWQIEETELALVEADNNNFATDGEVDKIFDKWN